MPPWSLAWSPQGQLATSGSDRQVRLWQPGTESPVAIYQIPAFCLGWHPDGNSFAVVPERRQSEAQQWGRDGRPHCKLLETRGTMIRCLNWSPDGKSLGVGCLHGGIVVLRQDGERTMEPFRTSKQEASVSWSPAGQLLSGSPLALWSGDGTKTTRIAGGEQTCAASWSPDGHRITARDAKGQVLVLTPEGSIVQTIPAASKGVLSPSGRLALLSADSKEYQVWNNSENQQPGKQPATEPVTGRAWTRGLKIPSGPRGSGTNGLAWDTSGKRLAMTGLGFLSLWEPDGNQGLRCLIATGPERVDAPVWSPDGALAGGSQPEPNPAPPGGWHPT